MNLPLDFELTEEMWVASRPQLEVLLKAQGWKGHEAQPADSNADKEPDETPG